MSGFVNYESMQADVLAYLASDFFLSNVYLFASKPADLRSEAAKSMSGLKVVNGKSGAAIEIGKPFLVDIEEEAPGPTGFIEMRFLVKTYPTINNGFAGTGLVAEAISLHLIQALLEWAAAGSQSGSFIPSPNCDTPAVGDKSDPWEGRYVVMRAKVAATPLLRTVAPEISEAPALTANISVGGPDAAAPILYTIDGSAPGYIQGTTNPAGTSALYVAPFAVASGTVIRCMALAPGKLPSVMNMSTIT